MTALPIYPFSTTFFFLSVVMMLRYLLLAGGLYYLTSKSKKPRIVDGQVPREQMLKDVGYSILSSIIFALGGTIIIRSFLMGKTQIYTDPAFCGWWYVPTGLLVYLIIHDSYFYWMHRLLHVVQFRRIHFIHHESRLPTAWTSFSFHPLEALLQAIVVPVLVFLIPIHVSALIAFLLIMSVCGVMNHLGYEFYPAFLEKRLKIISASHHQIHHGRVGYNFGLYFTFWDEWMKTEWRTGE